ncbi:hypothetical protein GCM10010470_32770 [Saccharopolyspora taberi]|uniref:Uncharacterized protein n=1 Tax=Saccharopolyspora taberi TaxID=60895 RepID=A0ABN3VDS1_9PSEU
MSYADGFSRFLCLAADAWRYGRGDDRRQGEIQRALVAALTDAAERAGLDRSIWRTQPGGDGELALLPSDGTEPRLVDAFIRELDAWLDEYNHDRVAEARLRLRVAMHHGVAYPAPNGYAGKGPVVVSRLLDCRPVRDALDMDSTANLALIISEQIFKDTVYQRHTSLRPEEFVRVFVADQDKDFQAEAWVRVPRIAPERLASALRAHTGEPAKARHLILSLQGVQPEEPMRIERAAEEAFTAAQLGSAQRRIEAAPDGTIISFQDHLQGASALGIWIEQFDRALRAGELGSSPAQVRIGVHCGQRQSDRALARRLAGSDITRDSLSVAHAARVAVAVSDEVFQSVVRAGGRYIDADRYRPVDAGAPAWLYIPGYSVPPDATRHRRKTRRPRKKTSAPQSASQVGTINGPATVLGAESKIETLVVGAFNDFGEGERP